MPTLTITHEDIQLLTLDGYKGKVYATKLIKIEDSENKRLRVNSFDIHIEINESEDKDDYFHNSRIEFHSIQEAKRDIFIFYFKEGIFEQRHDNDDILKTSETGYCYQFVDVDLNLEEKEFILVINYDLLDLLY